MRNTGFRDMGLGQRGFFSPVQIANCLTWLDASDASTITQVAGKVSQWNDKSGNGNNATQGTGSAQPTTGSVTMNGLNAISFNLSSNNFMNLPSGLYGITNGNNTVFASFELANATGDQRILTGSNNNSTSNLMLRCNSDFEFRDANSGGTATKTVTLNTSPHIVSVNNNGTTTTGYYDGSPAVTATSATTTCISMGIGCGPNGGGPYLNGALQDVIMYSRLLTNSEINIVGNWLSARSGATWTNI